MNKSKILNENKCLLVRNLVSFDLCYYLTRILLRKSEEADARTGDGQILNCLSIMDHEIVFETLQEQLWGKMEKIVGEELLPTYSYSRLYCNGNVLEKHKDRPSCEVSVTIQLGKSHDYYWPIYMEGKSYLLNEGDGVVYFGTEAEHWREKCDGPNGYFSGQVFLHYVRKNGKYAEFAGDAKVRTPPKFVKERNLLY